MKSLPIGEVLKEYGYINEEQLQIALDAQKKDRSKRLGEHLIDLGFVSEQQMLEALSDKLAEPLVSLDNIDFDIILHYIFRLPLLHFLLPRQLYIHFW